MNEMNELWPGGPHYLANGNGFPLSTDSVLLADFASGIRGDHIIDLGCGAGILTVLMHLSHPGSAICGLEIQDAAAAVCRDNLAANCMDTEGILTGDIRNYRELYAAGSFDLVICNPPYFPVSNGFSAPDPARAAARDERSCTLQELCEAAGWLCRWGGSFALVHRPERLSEICCALTSCGLEPKRMRMVQHHTGSAPNLLLLEARRGGKPGLSVLAPLLLTNEDGSDSAEVRRIYHRQGD